MRVAWVGPAWVERSKGVLDGWASRHGGRAIGRVEGRAGELAGWLADWYAVSSRAPGHAHLLIASSWKWRLRCNLQSLCTEGSVYSSSHVAHAHSHRVASGECIRIAGMPSIAFSHIIPTETLHCWRHGVPCMLRHDTRHATYGVLSNRIQQTNAITRCMSWCQSMLLITSSSIRNQKPQSTESQQQHESTTWHLMQSTSPSMP